MTSDPVPAGHEPEHKKTELQAADSRRLLEGSLGPVRYSYDSSRLRIAEITLPIPLLRDEQTWAVKLIPASRAKLLGGKDCHYGEVDHVQTCSAREEAGVALAFLERPLSDYRAAFRQRGVAERLTPDRLGEREGFSFAVKTGRSRTEYRFLDVSERTLLIARSFVAGSGAEDEALRAVIASIAKAPS